MQIINLTRKPRKIRRKSEIILADFWAIIAFVIIAIIAFIIFVATKHQSGLRTVEDFANKDAAYMLDSFLKAPYYGEEGKTVADIIAEDFSKRNYKRTKDTFQKFFSNIKNSPDFKKGDNYVEEEINIIKFCVNNGNYLLWLNIKDGSVTEKIVKCNYCDMASSMFECSTAKIIGRKNSELEVELVYDN
jgi:hypothetical protein